MSIVEIGGTVGDIESLPFLEAIRQLRQDIGRKDTLFIHLTLVPYIGAAGELKTKPTQHSVKELRAIGIQPDILLCRTDRILSKELKAKIALFCSVSNEAVITARDVSSIYEVPLVLGAEGIDKIILNQLELSTKESNMTQWQELVNKIRHPTDSVDIGIVGKYVEFGESYKSLNEALIHAGLFHNLKTNIHWIEAEGVEGENWADQLSKFDGILVPGGFGKRGIEGMIRAVNFARNQKVPFFGICLGMQCSVIEFARNVAGLQGANSSEFDPSTPHRVIYKLRELRGVDDLGGTMRLGAYPCILNSKSHTFNAYGVLELSERHRHRYEFNREYEEILIAQGMKIVGSSPDNNFVEVVELEDHPWFVGCQFHPEFKSKPLKPHPLFKGFINASYVNRNLRQNESQLETDQLINKRIK